MQEPGALLPDRVYWFREPTEFECLGELPAAARTIKQFAHGVFRRVDAEAGHYEFDGYPEQERERFRFLVPIGQRADIIHV